jgi:hypothetical protein
MILLEPAYKIFHTSVKFKRRTIFVTPFSGIFHTPAVFVTTRLLQQARHRV